VGQDGHVNASTNFFGQLKPNFDTFFCSNLLIKHPAMKAAFNKNDSVDII
jgi:hypothetical protein